MLVRFSVWFLPAYCGAGGGTLLLCPCSEVQALAWTSGPMHEEVKGRDCHCPALVVLGAVAPCISRFEMQEGHIGSLEDEGRAAREDKRMGYPACG